MKPLKNVLYLTYDGLTDPLGQSQILPYLCQLADFGFSISIISFEKNENYSTYRDDVAKECVRHQLKWVPLTYHKKPAVFSTLFDLYKLHGVSHDLVKTGKFSIVHCRSYLTSLVGLELQKKYGLKFIFDMRGFWADERVEGKIWNLRNPVFRIIYRYFKKKERHFFSNADAVVSLTHKAKLFIENQFNVASEKITVIPCSVDLSLFDGSKIIALQKNELRTRLNISQDDYIVLYLGSLGTWYLYDEMVLFFEKVKLKRPRSKFLFVTPDRHRVERRPDFIVCTVPRNEVPLYCSIANVSVAFIRPSFSKIASSATKMGELMALGVPVVTNPGWGDTEYMTELGASIVFWTRENEIDPTEWERGFDNLNFARKEMSLTSAVQKYRKIYEKGR